MFYMQFKITKRHFGEHFMNKNNLEIEIKKILLTGLQKLEYPVTKAIEDILQLLLFLHHENPQENMYILTAAQYIFAYLQLGLGYMEHKELFDSVLSKAGFPLSFITKLQAHNPTIIANKYQLRSIIGKWPASSYNSHTITEAIAEIIDHVENNDIGEYQYYTAGKDGIHTALYQLTISSGYILFHDVFMNHFYQLRKK